MTTATRPQTVAAGKLDATIQRLRHSLQEYRDELTQSEAAFQVWQTEWQHSQQEIDAHLQTIETRLKKPTTGPTLAVIHPDE